MKLSTRCLLMVLLGLTMASCSGNKEVVNLYNWTYFIPDEILARFEKEQGIKVRLESYDGNETMYAKLATGNHQFDIAVPSGDYVSIMQNKGMLSPLEKDLLPNISNIDPHVLSYTEFDPEHTYSVPYFLGSPGIHVNTEVVKEYPESWSIFENDSPLLAQRMSMMNDMRDIMGGALRYLGYSGNSINPDEIAQARDLIRDKWKPHVIFDSEGFGKSFASGSTLVAQGFAEVVLKEIEDPALLAKHKFFIPKEGGMIYFDNFVVLNKGQNKKNAHQFINFMLQPDVHAYVADEFFYPVIMPAAEALRKGSAPYTVEEILQKSEFRRDLGENITLYTEAWNQIFQGN